MERPARFRTPEDFRDCIPVHAVWEITLACDLKCLHCGSRAGKKRTDELSTAECFEVIEALANLGTREVNLIGGEAYLRKDWADLVRHIRGQGMRCLIQTGGRNFSQKFIDMAVDAGLNGLGVSLDGLEESHDYLRGVPGSFQRAVETLRMAREAGLSISVNTQIGTRTVPDLSGLLDRIIEIGATHWQVQLTVAMGNAVDHPELLLQPYQLAEVMPLLADLYKHAEQNNVLIVMGNNIGYFGPYEHLWRGFGDDRVHWTGCSGGHTVIALEADGLVKGCPSLESVEYGAGNIRTMSLESIWRRSERISFSRLRSSEQLWGFCGSCYYRDACLGGCTWTSHSLFGRAGNNPYCHHRVLELEKQGLRERIVKKKDAPDRAFAIGEFDLVCEPIAGSAEPAHRQPPVVNIQRISPRVSKTKTKKNGNGQRELAELALCRNCQQYVYPDETICPHCKADIKKAHTRWVRAQSRMLASQARLERALEALKEEFIFE
jgi:Y-X(10)_GDL-associated radical SAM protein